MKYLKTYPEKCNGCNVCMSVCAKLYFKEDNPEKSAIKVTAAGKNAFALTVCDQCRDCVPECPTMALTVSKQGVVMLNKSLCINCLACVAVCPTSTMMTYRGGLAPFKCIACDACAKECPTGALKIEIKEIVP
jgi:carbon-monoxide dehydrogenase iron sulfur subunit